MSKENMISVSFKEGMQLTGHPLVNIVSELTNKNYLFIVDTGASTSYIFPNLFISESMELSPDSGKNICYGLDGNPMESCLINMTFLLEQGKFSHDMFLLETMDTVNTVKETFGIEIHGLLGLDFLVQNKLILDYSSNTLHN